MLENGLGDIVTAELGGESKYDRFVDLFAGAGFVSSFVAERTDCPVWSVDLQEYSGILTGAIVERTKPLKTQAILDKWIMQSESEFFAAPKFDEALALSAARTSRKVVFASRRFSGARRLAPVLRAYGGHYFSPKQSMWIDALLRKLPRRRQEALVCHAALIRAASRAASAPGHTAQPFQPSRHGNRAIAECWGRNVPELVGEELARLAPRHARCMGRTSTSDAVEIVPFLKATDLVFVDPPYSAVHYSRFYHVLETIARRGCGPVSGTGRYPPPRERPKSDFSIKTKAPRAVASLLRGIAERGATVVFTFPAGPSSNGVSGRYLQDIASPLFRVRRKVVRTRFSTLGGDYAHRKPRRTRGELILKMSPRR